MSEAKLTFLASIAPLQSAITIASDGGARIKIDIPESEMGAIVRLMLMWGMVLRITIEPETALKNKQKQNATKRYDKQSQWQTAKESGDDGHS